MRAKHRDDDELTNLLAKTAKTLPDNARQALLANPQALRSALAAAASALTGNEASIESIGSDDPAGLIDADDATRRIEARAVPARKQEFLSSEEMGERIGITRPTVHEWLRCGKIIGWQGARRGYLFPAAQLDKHGQPPAGLQRITALLGNEQAAWDWLTSELTLLDGDTALTRLRAGDVDEVEGAALSYREGAFV